uniref:CB1 cannabinoid receptor-interacting protein 1 n=1 Tax=Otus sunia TaxID=257818 RepID=A0A8C8B7Y0_9STRI
MGDIPGLVKISVSLKIQPNDGAVYFKVDGQRFGQNRTIKLLTGAKYKIEVALRPGTVQATTMGIGGVNVPLEEISRDAQVASYTGIYDTEGVPHTKSGERQPIQVNMQVRGTPSLARGDKGGGGLTPGEKCGGQIFQGKVRSQLLPSSLFALHW